MYNSRHGETYYEKENSSRNTNRCIWNYNHNRKHARKTQIIRKKAHVACNFSFLISITGMKKGR